MLDRLGRGLVHVQSRALADEGAGAVDPPVVDDVVARLGRVTRNLYASVDDLTDKGCTVRVSTE